MHDIDQTWINSITWRVVYVDGKAKLEHNADGTTNRYEDIDRYRMKRFDLLDGEGKRIFSVFPRFGRQLIFRRRRFFKGTPGENNPNQWTVILIGWHERITVGGGAHSAKSIAYIYPNKVVDFDNARSDLVIREQEW